MGSAPVVVVVDANVLFPLTLRDTVLRAAAAGYFRLRWSREILDEMERNLVATGTMGAGNAMKLRATMDQYFPEAMVTGHELLIEELRNDAEDRHVVAVAVKSGAQLIATNNLRDFVPLPEGVEAQSPDEFLCNLFDLDPDGFVALLQSQSADLRNPPVSMEMLLERLDRVVPEFVQAVRQHRSP
jgi:predicted nucleic acid-binding protein